jgi:hypothetical protein
LGLPTFVKHLRLIHTFVCRGDSFDALRGVVCGIEFGPNSFLVNTRQLKKLMFRSKSCMNGCFQRLGYAVCRPTCDIATLLGKVLPGWGSHLFIARQWCVRKAVDPHSASFTPNLACEIAADGDELIAELPVGRDADCPFIFDIKNLLNHPAPGSDTQRMSAPGPLAC